MNSEQNAQHSSVSQHISNEMLAAVDSKTIEQLILDTLVGKKIKCFKREYLDFEYDKCDQRPKFNYDTFFHGEGCESVVCEIMDVKIKDTKEYKIRLIMSDNGVFADLRVRLSEVLQFIK